jgi:hypothetical protein
MSLNTPLTAITARAWHAATIAARVAGVLKQAWAALTTGSRTLPFGDNAELFRELAARIAASKSRTRGL